VFTLRASFSAFRNNPEDLPPSHSYVRQSCSRLPSDAMLDTMFSSHLCLTLITCMPFTLYLNILFALWIPITIQNSQLLGFWHHPMLNFRYDKTFHSERMAPFHGSPSLLVCYMGSNYDCLVNIISERMSVEYLQPKSWVEITTRHYGSKRDVHINAASIAS
jgi:hypothetical protein